MARTPKTPKQIATVWIFTEAARERGHNIDLSWAAQFTQENLTGPYSMDWNPVEINIRPEDVPAAVAKWEAVAGVAGVCRVRYTAKLPTAGRGSTLRLAGGREDDGE